VKATAVVREHSRHLGWLIEWQGQTGRCRSGQLYISVEVAEQVAKSCGAKDVLLNGRPLDESKEFLAHWEPYH
jgi:hypothetical protein